MSRDHDPGPISTRNPNLDLERPHHAPDPADPLVGPRPASWWTGAVPRPGTCPGLDAEGRIHALRTPDLSRCTRQEVLAYFDNTWAITEVLFSSLQGERAFYAPPWHRLRHPMIFYYCHPAALYINKLRITGLVTPIDAEIETLFQTGVDEMSWDDLTQTELDWPSIETAIEYRRTAFARVRALIETHPGLASGHAPITQDDPLWALFMSLEHERIHVELSSMLARELPIEWVRRPPEWPPLHPSVPAAQIMPPLAGRDYPRNELVEIPAGLARIGKPRSWPSYGWDNEYGSRTIEMSAFRASKLLVSNGEYFEFVRDEGYLDRSLWSSDGWGWRQFRNAKWPTFWVSAGPSGLHEYRLRTQFEIVPMPWSWPVEVNFHEAHAYRAWRERRDGIRYSLPSEALHHRMRDESHDAPDGLPDAGGHNLHLAYSSPGPVDAFAPTTRGLHDVHGNLWHWCEDHFHPLPGFRIHPLYDDFSTPCFDGKHQTILGGSFVSTGDEASVWARFHFRPHFHQHAGIRLLALDGASDAAVKLDDGGARSVDVYEREDALRQYLLLHYGSAEDSMPYEFGPRDAIAFPQRCARAVIDVARRLGIEPRRALDVGCAVGGATFELARAFESVLGVDRSDLFVRSANTLREHGRVTFFQVDEGELGHEIEAVVDPAIDRGRVQFRAGDACALPAELVGLDAVLAANLLCRIPSPKALLDRMAGPRGVVRVGGVVVFTSPFTWSESFTPKEAWLGGTVRDGHAVASADGLAAALGRDFELVVSEDVPLVIREHRRKYQYIVARLTAWRRLR